MKRAPLYILVSAVAILLSLLGYSLYLYLVDQPVNQSSLGLVCTALFLVFAFIAIELLYKPHLFLRPKEAQEEDEKEEGV